MPAKKEKSGAAKPKTAAAPVHGSYKEMVRDAIIKLKERNGSSRAKLKQYVLANNKGLESGSSFDTMFNKAVKSGVEKGEFAQPKGPSGTVKLAKKEPVTTEKKPAAAAKKTTKADAPKKTTKAPKKAATGTTKAKAAPKKTATTKAKAPAKPKSAANTGAKRKSKTPAAAPAVVDEKKVLGKTKSGRVTKTAAKPAAKKAAPKKKAASTPAKKEKTPKKATPAKEAAA